MGAAKIYFLKYWSRKKLSGEKVVGYYYEALNLFFPFQYFRERGWAKFYVLKYSSGRSQTNPSPRIKLKISTLNFNLKDYNLREFVISTKWNLKGFTYMYSIYHCHLRCHVIKVIFFSKEYFCILIFISFMFFL